MLHAFLVKIFGYETHIHLTLDARGLTVLVVTRDVTWEAPTEDILPPPIPAPELLETGGKEEPTKRFHWVYTRRHILPFVGRGMPLHR